LISLRLAPKEIGRIHSEFAYALVCDLSCFDWQKPDLRERAELKLAKARFIDKNQGKKFEVDAQAALEPEIKKLEDGNCRIGKEEGVDRRRYRCVLEIAGGQ